MKAFLFLGTLISMNIALACGADGQTELQFFGNVRNLNHYEGEAGQIEHFTYQISIDVGRASQNPNCPLDIDAAEQHTWSFRGAPTVQSGQEVSGVLVFDSKTDTYHIE